MIVVAALGAMLLLMLGELRISRRNERVLRSRGATAPRDPVYATMRWAYPGAFVCMAAEGLLRGTPNPRLMLAGAVVIVVAKLLKGWAIHSLRERWTYHVFILPDAPLVTSGPYRWIRHPNYLGVAGELVGFAILVGGRWTGPLGVLAFGELLRQRIKAEEQALGLSR
jgi:methyltransferase